MASFAVASSRVLVLGLGVPHEGTDDRSELRGICCLVKWTAARDRAPQIISS
jgi:hypothetical protein